MKDFNRKENFSNIYNRISLLCSKTDGAIKLLNHESILDFTSFILGYRNHKEYKQANKKTKNNSLYESIDVSTTLLSLKPKSQIPIQSLDQYNINCKKIRNKENNIIAEKDNIVSSIVYIGYDYKSLLKSYEKVFINPTKLKILSKNKEHKIIKEMIDSIKASNTKIVELNTKIESKKIDFLSFLYNKNLLEDFFYDENDQFSHIFLHIIDQNYIQKDEQPSIDELIQFCRLDYLLASLFSNKSTSLLKNIIKKYLLKNINFIFDNSDTISFTEQNISQHEKNSKLVLSKILAIKNLYDLSVFESNGFYLDNSNTKHTEVYCKKDDELEEEMFSYIINKCLEHKTFNNSYLINKTDIRLGAVNSYHIDISDNIADYEDYSDILIIDKEFNYLHNQFIVDFHIYTKNTQPIFSQEYKWGKNIGFYLKKNNNNLNEKYEMRNIYFEKP